MGAWPFMSLIVESLPNIPVFMKQSIKLASNVIYREGLCYGAWQGSCKTPIERGFAI